MAGLVPAIPMRDMVPSDRDRRTIGRLRPSSRAMPGDDNQPKTPPAHLNRNRRRPQPPGPRRPIALTQAPLLLRLRALTDRADITDPPTGPAEVRRPPPDSAMRPRALKPFVGTS